MPTKEKHKHNYNAGTEPTKRIEWLDFMKGIAILIVVIGHVAQSLEGAHPFTNLIIICEMPLFFCLSGILANKTLQRPLLISFKKKAQSLLIPYMAVGSLFAFSFNQFDSFLFDTYHNGYWFLLSLFSCWIIFLPIGKLSQHVAKGKFKLIVEFILLLFPFFLYRFVENLIPNAIEKVFTLNFTFTYYRFFIVGYFIGKLQNYYTLSKKLGGGVIVCVVLFTIVIILNESIIACRLPMTVLQFVLSAGLIYVLYIFYQSSTAKIRRLFTWFGQDSLIIYTFHFFLKPYARLEFISGAPEFWVLLSTILSSMIVCIVCLIVSIPIKSNQLLRMIILGRDK